MRRGTRHLLAVVLLLGLLALIPSAAAAQTFAGKVTNYVDQRQQTALSFGDRSHWLQPWRAYLDTVPATKLREAIGIQFNVSAQEATSTARLLAANGFKRARVEVGWDSISYDSPTQLADPGLLRTKLQALKTYGIRPLILLNSNHGAPCPTRFFDARLVEPAAQGARRVHLDAATAQAVVPGRTGLNGTDSDGTAKAADVLFTSVDSAGWATLSKPLPKSFAAGNQPAATLRYEPFQRPKLGDGSPNPSFEDTSKGWLDYVGAVTSEAKSVLGSDAFDVEVWNEQSFGADFLDADNYYEPAIGSESYREAVLGTPGLVSYWRLGEASGTTAVDQKASNTGAYSGSPALGRSGLIAGDTDTATGFDGQDDHVAVPDSASLDISGPLSIEAWIKVGTFDRDWQAIVTKGDSAYRLHRCGGANTVCFGTNGLSNVDLSANVDVTDGKTHHVVGVWDGSRKSIYIDGSLANSTIATGTVSANSYDLAIGENRQQTGRFFNGTIDEAAVYGAALSANSVRRHYSEGHAGPGGDKAETDKTILARTVSWLRDPAHSVPNVGVGNGFASQRPWDAGSTSPAGLTAIDKHPYLYSGMRNFAPSLTWQTVDETRPLDAQGDVDGTQNASGDWTERVTPTYNSFHPEYYLWATHKVQRYFGFPIQMDHLIRDLSPITTSIGSVAHGRNTNPPGAAAPGMWVTEMNIDPAGAPGSGLTSADRPHFQAKVTLRTLASFVNKGASAVDMYAVKDGNFALVAGSFFSTLASTGTYPGDGAGGEVMDSVRRLSAAFGGAASIASPRQLSLLEIGDYAGNKQFDGDGSADHPPLYNRDVLAFLPFQLTDKQFVIPIYVMTTNLAKNYKPSAPSSDKTRYDMPAEVYRFTIGGLRGTRAKLSATDPLTGSSVPVTVVSKASDRVVVEMAVTDSPRILTIRE